MTGTAGFIGSHVAQRLLREGWEVVGLDNFDPFYDPAVKEGNLAPLRQARHFHFVRCDIRDLERLKEGFAAHGPFDAIIHLAARAGVRPSIQQPLLYAEVNVTGTLNLLQLAVQTDNRPAFLFASSSSVYGNNPKTPFSESDPVDHPISPYAATKKAGELMAFTYHHLYGLSVFCLRFFTVFGPRQRPDLAIHQFARALLAGKPIRMFGDGRSSRDYTYIDDIVDGVVRAAERCRGYEIINLGGNHPVGLRQMIDTVARACNVVPVIEQVEVQAGDVERTFADISKAQRLLDYQPATDFEEGVRRQVEWMKSAGVV